MGVGFVAAPGLLTDVPAWLEWWQLRPDGRVQPLLLDLDPATSAYSDYTHWDWYALPRDSGRRAISGPYVDYLCTDEYSLTLAAPVHGPDGAFAGVVAADVYLRHFDAVAVPALRALGRPAFLVNPRGRVVASTTAARLAGDLVRDLDGSVVHPCSGIPLRLVTPTG
ncbi:cache domain-containing protein [Streptacidiphilus melanogenes]|uniref:cache domain-containing protein n=1 Tax=Streptacidiphilus melanogenes TaxID=411235 RepID=UPI000A887BB2